MAVLKPRGRLVYFRISEAEFNQFSSVCAQGGAHSISDLARDAVQRLIADGNRGGTAQELVPKIESLEKMIAEVTAQLRMLTALRAQGVSGNNEVKENPDVFETTPSDYSTTEDD